MGEPCESTITGGGGLNGSLSFGRTRAFFLNLMRRLPVSPPVSSSTSSRHGRPCCATFNSFSFGFDFRASESAFSYISDQWASIFSTHSRTWSSSLGTRSLVSYTPSASNSLSGLFNLGHTARPTGDFSRGNFRLRAMPGSLKRGLDSTRAEMCHFRRSQKLRDRVSDRDRLAIERERRIGEDEVHRIVRGVRH